MYLGNAKMCSGVQTHKHTATHRQDQLQYTALQLMCSVKSVRVSVDA